MRCNLYIWRLNYLSTELTYCFENYVKLSRHCLFRMLKFLRNHSIANYMPNSMQKYAHCLIDTICYVILQEIQAPQCRRQVRKCVVIHSCKWWGFALSPYCSLWTSCQFHLIGVVAGPKTTMLSRHSDELSGDRKWFQVLIVVILTKPHCSSTLLLLSFTFLWF